MTAVGQHFRACQGPELRGLERMLTSNNYTKMPGASPWLLKTKITKIRPATEKNDTMYA